MPSRSRIAEITATLVFAGAISGASGGAFAMTAAVLTFLRTTPNAALLALSAAVGAVIGAPTLPVLGWVFLRDVPLRAAITGTGIATAVGGTVGLLVGASAVNPYVPFSVFLPPFPQCAVGGVVGATLAAGGMRAYFRRQARIRVHAG
jgi:hypothetical protein